MSTSPDSHVENQRLRDQLAAFQVQLEELRSQFLPTLPSGQPSTPASNEPEIPAGKDPKLAEPPDFDGNSHEYITFFSLITQYLEQKPRTFPNDRSRTAYFISHLRKEPAQWATTLIATQSPLLQDYPAFLTEFAAIYADTDRITDLRTKLHFITQTGSARDFASRFSTICTGLRILDDSTRTHLFLAKLKPELQTGLDYYATQQKIPFATLVQHALRIDKSQHKERKARSEYKGTKSGKSSFSQTNPPFISSKSNIPNSSKKTIFKPRGPLSAAEKQRRRDNNLCFYCGSSEHTFENCPAKKAKEQANETSTTSYKSHVSSVIIDSENSDPQNS